MRLSLFSSLSCSMPILITSFRTSSMYHYYFIFVCLFVRRPLAESSIRYIQRFRSTSKLQGEAAYYLSSISGAIQFIETMDASALSNITQADFESNVEAAIQALPPSPSPSSGGDDGRTGTSFGALGGFRTPGRDEGRERERDSKLMSLSPFAATTPGEEAARLLSMASAAQATGAGAALEGTRKWFARTGNLAQEAVSKPLNAIGKIWEGMSPADTRQGSEDGSGDEAAVVGPTAGGGTPGGVPPGDVFGSRRFRASTPESLSTPSSDMLPDFSALDIQSTIDASQETYAQTRLANVQTLHQMFPALEEEIVEAVLEGCGDDLGLAIDRLLEM